MTTGDWELRTLHGIDESSGWIYFSGTERSYIGLDVYRVKLDGSGMKRLTERAGTPPVDVQPRLHARSSTRGATRARRRRSGCTRRTASSVRLIHESKIAALATLALAKPELLQVKTRDGFVMEAMLIKPPEHRSRRASIR